MLTYLYNINAFTGSNFVLVIDANFYNFLIFAFISSLFFYVTICVITSTNLIYSIFYMILLFLMTVLILFFLGVDFIAFLILIIYVGAILVLFLFIIMMVQFYTILKNFSLPNLLFSLSCLSFVHFIGMEFLSMYFLVKSATPVIFFNFNNLYTENFLYIMILNPYNINNLNLKFLNFNTLEEITFFINSFYVIAFLLCSMILFIGILGVLLLVKTSKESKRKQQFLSEQILKSFI